MGVSTYASWGVKAELTIIPWPLGSCLSSSNRELSKSWRSLIYTWWRVQACISISHGPAILLSNTRRLAIGPLRCASPESLFWVAGHHQLMFDLETRARVRVLRIRQSNCAAIFTVDLTHVAPPPDQLHRDKWGQLRFACFFHNGKRPRKSAPE